MLAVVTLGMSWVGVASLGLSFACAGERPRASEPAPVAEGRTRAGARSPSTADPNESASDADPDRERDGVPPTSRTRESPNLAILLIFESSSVNLEEGKNFELWNGLADAILEANACAEIRTYRVDDDDASRALATRRAVEAGRFLLRKGFAADRVLVEPHVDPGELMSRGIQAEHLRNAVLLSPNDHSCPFEASAP